MVGTSEVVVILSDLEICIPGSAGHATDTVGMVAYIDGDTTGAEWSCT